MRSKITALSMAFTKSFAPLWGRRKPYGFGALRVRFALRGGGVRRLSTNIYGGSIDRVLQVRGVEFLDHLDGGAAVLGDLVDVGAFHQPQADIGMPQRMGRPPLTFPVELHLEFIEHGIEVMLPQIRKQQVGGPGQGKLLRTGGSGAAP